MRFNRDHGVTIVVVTHESDIAAYAERVITMRDGGHRQSDRTRRPGAGSRAEPRATRRRTPTVRRRRVEGAGRIDRGGIGAAFALMIGGAALQALTRNKLRSALTMLGVFIGVAALIAMVAVGQGANQAVRKQIESLGTNMFVVVPGRRRGRVARRFRQCVDADRRRCGRHPPRSDRPSRT